MSYNPVLSIEPLCLSIQLAFASCSLKSGKGIGRVWPGGSQLLDYGSPGSEAIDCIGTLLKDVDPWLPEHISYLDMTEILKDLFCS